MWSLLIWILWPLLSPHPTKHRRSEVSANTLATIRPDEPCSTEHVSDSTMVFSLKRECLSGSLLSLLSPSSFDLPSPACPDGSAHLRGYESSCLYLLSWPDNYPPPDIFVLTLCKYHAMNTYFSLFTSHLISKGNLISTTIFFSYWDFTFKVKLRIILFKPSSQSMKRSHHSRSYVLLITLFWWISALLSSVCIPVIWEVLGGRGQPVHSLPFTSLPSPVHLWTEALPDRGAVRNGSNSGFWTELGQEMGLGASNR